MCFYGSSHLFIALTMLGATQTGVLLTFVGKK